MPEHYSPKSGVSSHTKGTQRGEERAKKSKEPGREKETPTARSATSINAKHRGPIDKKMPHIQPA